MREENMDNQEVITGGDFRRMVTGAYSEFLLEYENLNQLDKKRRPAHRGRPGTDILRTMGAAVMALRDCQDDSIGGLARRVGSAAILGARGNAGVILAQIFRGLRKGLLGKYHASSSEFGKAFQYGILYAQRALPDEPERPIVRAARAVAKGAYRAVRANLPIVDILSIAIAAGEQRNRSGEGFDVGEAIMQVFLRGCQKGLHGNFVSPALNFSVGSGEQRLGLPDPRADEVHPFCLTFQLTCTRPNAREMEKYLRQTASFVVVERRSDKALYIHLHTARPGGVLEQSLGFGMPEAIALRNMSEPHEMALAGAGEFPMAVALVAIAGDEARADYLQRQGAHLIALGEAGNVPSVGALINAAHSDLAATYVIVADGPRLNLTLLQVKALLGRRVEILLTRHTDDQDRAVQAFDRNLSAADNAAKMRALLAES